MERKLPPQYEGWRAHEPALRHLTTPELVTEVQDGPPDRRLAALSLLDLAEVPPATIEDWIRTLPDTEANELAGAIPAQRPHEDCSEDLRWVEVARSGYERRVLPTFLVMLLSSLESLEASGCNEAPVVWERIADWLGTLYDRFASAANEQALDDLTLFVFENYLGQDALFEAFCGMIARHEDLARKVSANPSAFLTGLALEKQRTALEEAARSGGLPFEEAWAALHQY